MKSQNIKITGEALKSAFEFFDTNKKGYIEKTDLQRVFGKKYNNEILEKIIMETDATKTGQISFLDFCKIMENNQISNKNMIPNSLTLAQITSFESKVK